MKLLFTGGHITPALAFIEYLKAKHPEVTMIFVGRAYSRNGQKSHEQEELEQLGVPFIPFTTGKILRRNWSALPKELWLFLSSFFTALAIIGEQKPTAVVSFGSYFAVPLVFAAWIWRIPIITHEQTRSAGIANTTIATYATCVALSHKESEPFFPSKKTKLIGSLLRKPLFAKQPTKPTWYTPSTKPLLYITGGNQGSEIINTTIAQCLPQLVKKWQVIHQCGNQTATRNYQQELLAKRQTLSPSLRTNYSVFEWITERDLAWIYQNATAAISRAGANTTEELLRAQLPSIFVPLPFSHRDEQLLNARAVAKTGGALLLPQQQLTPHNLIKNLDTVLMQQKKMKKALSEHAPAKDSEKKFFELIVRAIEK